MDEELRIATFLLFQKVKVAVAVVVIRSTPANMTVKNFAAIFQRKFRKTTKRVNLQLERQVFYEQLLVLLPAFKIFTAESSCEEPMDVDDISIRGVDCGNVPELLMLPVSEEYAQFLYVLTSTSQFLDAIQETKILSERTATITKNDILKLLSKFQETNAPRSLNTADANHEYYSCVSSSLLNYMIKSLNIDRIIKEGTKQIMKLIQEYFDRVPSEIKNAQGFSSVKYASEVLLKHFENCHTDDKNQQLLSSFMQETARSLLSKESDLFGYWYGLLGSWKRNEAHCIRILDGLLLVWAKKYGNGGMVAGPENFCGLLNCVKKLLTVFYKQHCKFGLQKNGAETEIFEKSYVRRWEAIIKNTIVLSLDRKQQSISRLSWNCLQVIMLLKCRRSKCEIRNQRN